MATLEDEVQRTDCEIVVMECDFMGFATDFVRPASDFTPQLSAVRRMSKFTAGVSDLKKQILLCQPQLNTKRFRRKIRELKNETTVLKAQHELMMLYQFVLDYQEMKPAVSAPATIHAALLFDSRIISDFRRCLQCLERIVLKLWGEAIAMVSVRQRFTPM
jgi:hypothetical protein